MRVEIPEWRYALVPHGMGCVCDWCGYGRAGEDRWFYQSTDGKNRVCFECFEFYLKDLREQTPEAFSHIDGMEWAEVIAEGPPDPSFAHEVRCCRFWYSANEHREGHDRCYYRTAVYHDGVEWIEEMFAGPTMTALEDRDRGWKRAVDAYLGYERRMITSAEQLAEVFPLLKDELAKRDDRAEWLERLLPKRSAPAGAG